MFACVCVWERDPDVWNIEAKQTMDKMLVMLGKTAKLEDVGFGVAPTRRQPSELSARSVLQSSYVSTSLLSVISVLCYPPVAKFSSITITKYCSWPWHVTGLWMCRARSAQRRRKMLRWEVQQVRKEPSQVLLVSDWCKNCDTSPKIHIRRWMCSLLKATWPSGTLSWQVFPLYLFLMLAHLSRVHCLKPNVRFGHYRIYGIARNRPPQRQDRNHRFPSLFWKKTVGSPHTIATPRIDQIRTGVLRWDSPEWFHAS